MVFQESISSYIPHSWQKTITTSLLIIAPFVFTYAITYLKSINDIKSKSEGIEAPPVPYTVPFFGNVFSFAFNTAGTFQTIMYIPPLVPQYLLIHVIEKIMALHPSAYVSVRIQSTSSLVAAIFQPSSPNHEICPPKHYLSLHLLPHLVCRHQMGKSMKMTTPGLV